MSNVDRFSPILKHTAWLLPLVTALLSYVGVRFFFDSVDGFSWLWLANAVAAGWIALHSIYANRTWPSGVVLLGVFIALNLVNTPALDVSLDGLFMSSINIIEVAVAAKLLMSLLQSLREYRETRAIQRALLKCAALTLVTLTAIALCAGTYFSLRYGTPMVSASVEWLLSNIIAYSAVGLMMQAIGSRVEAVRLADWAVFVATLVVAIAFHNPQNLIIDLLLLGLLIVLSSTIINLKLVGWALIALVAIDFYPLVGSSIVDSHVQHVAFTSLYALLGAYIASTRQIGDQLNNELALSHKLLAASFDATQMTAVEYNVRTKLGRLLEGETQYGNLIHSIDLNSAIKPYLPEAQQPVFLGLLDKHEASEELSPIDPSTGEIAYWGLYTVGMPYERDGETYNLLLRHKITPLVVSREAARAANVMQSIAVEAAGLGVFRHNHVTDKVTCNEQLLRLLELAPDYSIQKDDLIRALHPDERERVAQFMSAQRATLGSGAIETRNLINGRLKYFSAHVSHQRNAQGQDETYVAILDVTDQKTKEAALELQNRWLRLGSEAADLGLWSYNKREHNVQWNSRYRAMMGVSGDTELSVESAFQIWTDRLHPEDREHVLAEVAEADMTGETISSLEQRYRIINTQGDVQWLRVNLMIERDAKGAITQITASVLDETKWVEQQQVLEQTVKRLTASRELFEQVASAANVAFTEFDPASGEFSPSQAYREMFELPEETYPTILPEHEFSRYAERSLLKVQAAFNSSLAGVATEIHEAELALPSGVRRIIDIRPSFIEVDGRTKLNAVFIDQTQLYGSQRQARALAEQLADQARQTELALNAGQISVFELDVDSGQAIAVSGHHPMLKQGESTQVLETARPLVSPDDLAQLETVLRAENAECTIRVNPPNAEKSIWSRVITGTQYQSGGRTKNLVVRFDVTELRASVETMRIAKERQRELFAVVGHELRTPVASIEMVMRDEDLSPAEKVSTITEITHNLLSVLEDMRTVVAPERAKESREVYADPSEVVRRAVSPLTPIAREHNLNVELHLPDMPMGARYFFSEQALRQLVTNLVKNAALHSQGSLVRVSLGVEAGAEPDDTYQATLRIEDDGRGLPAGSKELMFEAFTRGESKANGSGLGLYIAQGLASELGGTIEYDTSEMGGASFTVRFELTSEHTAQQAQAQAQAQAQSVTLNGMRILVAEDETMLRMLSEKMLTKQGAQVTSVENGQLALELFDPTQFDLVLTDLMMPKLDGHGLTRAIRETGATTPIIAVTAAVVGDETDQVLALGADGYISKPISPEKLLEALRKLNREVKYG